MGFVYRQVGFGTSWKSLACYATETGQGCWANNTGLVTRAGDEDVELTDIETRTSVESR